jgi:hypothetical protein
MKYSLFCYSADSNNYKLCRYLFFSVLCSDLELFDTDQVIVISQFLLCMPFFSISISLILLIRVNSMVFCGVWTQIFFVGFP